MRVKLLLLVCAIAQITLAQKYMLVGQKGGIVTQFPMENVDSVYFSGYDEVVDGAMLPLSYSPSLCSSWKPSNLSRVFSDFIEDSCYLYAVGQFGIRKFDFSNPNDVSLISSYYFNDLSVSARSVAIKDDYVYVSYRSTLPMEKERAKPEIRLDFEDNRYSFYKSDSSSFVLSDNVIINSFFNALKIVSFDASQIDRIYIYKARNMGGYFRNNLLIQKAGGSSVSFGSGNYNTEEEALNALNDEYTDNYGNYCSVNWNSVSIGGRVFENIKLNMQYVSMFDTFSQKGTAFVSQVNISSPNRWVSSAQFSSLDKSSDNHLILNKKNDFLSDESYQSFWLHIPNNVDSVITIPLLAEQSVTFLSLIISPINSSCFRVALKVGGVSYYGGDVFKVRDWYNFKVHYSKERADLSFRNKECDKWKTLVSSENHNKYSPEVLQLGIITGRVNASFYVDDYYFNSSDLDGVSYINGRLDVLNKKDLSFVKTYNLDHKANAIAVCGNSLVVNFLSGFNVYDLTNPENPQLKFYKRPSSYKEYQGLGVYSVNSRNYAFLCNYHKGFTIVDITNPDSCCIVKEVPLPDTLCINNTWKIQLWDAEINYPYVYVAASPNSQLVGTKSDMRGIVTFNISDLEEISSTFSKISQNDYWSIMSNGDRQPTCIARCRDYLFLNNEELGVAVFKINQANIPEYVECLKLPDGAFCNALYVTKNNYLIVGDGDSGNVLYPNKQMYIYKLNK